MTKKEHTQSKSLDESIRRFNKREMNIPELDLLEKAFMWNIPYQDFLDLFFPSENDSSDKCI